MAIGAVDGGMVNFSHQFVLAQARLHIFENTLMHAFDNPRGAAHVLKLTRRFHRTLPVHKIGGVLECGLRQIFHQHALGVGGEVGKVGNRRAERASGTIGRASGARDGEGEGVALYGHSGRVYGVDRGAVGDLGSEHLAGHVRLVGAHRVEKGSVPVEP